MTFVLIAGAQQGPEGGQGQIAGKMIILHLKTYYENNCDKKHFDAHSA